jgi:DNA-binding NarL/FixJ family response regulator
MGIKVLVADDHVILRHGLRLSLEQDGEIQVVAEAGNGRETLEMVQTHDPDVVLMDVSMPDMNGIEATRKIMAESSGVRVLGLSMHLDKRYVMGMLMAGAAGYLIKSCPFEELVLAVRTVAEGKVYLSPEIAGVVLDRAVKPGEACNGAVTSGLTPREREVLQLVAEGNTTRDIADRLALSERTVETHRRQIMNKLNLRSVAELTKLAVREGLTTLEL